MESRHESVDACVSGSTESTYVCATIGECVRRAVYEPRIVFPSSLCAYYNLLQRVGNVECTVL